MGPALPDMPPHYYFDPDLRGRRISGFAARPLRAFPVAETIAARRRNWALYRDLLDGIAGVTPVCADLDGETCPPSMAVFVAGRDRIAAALQARGIAATPWWSGFHRHLDWSDQPDAVWLKRHVLSLPLHQTLDDRHIRFVADSLRRAMR